jgi:hypothetical protein
MILVSVYHKKGAAGIRTRDGGFAIHCLSHLATAPCIRAFYTLKSTILITVAYFEKARKVKTNFSSQ